MTRTIRAPFSSLQKFHRDRQNLAHHPAVAALLAPGLSTVCGHIDRISPTRIDTNVIQIECVGIDAIRGASTKVVVVGSVPR